jgi:hypothetical protein
VKAPAWAIEIGHGPVVSKASLSGERRVQVFKAVATAQCVGCGKWIEKGTPFTFNASAAKPMGQCCRKILGEVR